MKPFKNTCTLILCTISLFPISSANADVCNSHNKKKAEIKFLSYGKNCIDAKEKESLYKIEA